MESLIKNKYVMQDVNKNKLKSCGFRYDKRISNDEETYFFLRFPLLRYLKSTTVEGEVVVSINDGSVKLDAYTYGTNSFYPPFYQDANNKIYENIIRNINNKFEEIFGKVGIIKI